MIESVDSLKYDNKQYHFCLTRVPHNQYERDPFLGRAMCGFMHCGQHIGIDGSRLLLLVLISIPDILAQLVGDHLSSTEFLGCFY